MKDYICPVCKFKGNIGFAGDEDDRKTFYLIDAIRPTRDRSAMIDVHIHLAICPSCGSLSYPETIAKNQRKETSHG
jgi:hypothetical protein